MLLSEDIVRFLYGTGKFLARDAEPVRRTSGVVFYSCLGLVFYSVNAILVRALYAMKDMKTPTRTLFHSVLLNFGLNLFFVLAAPRISEWLYPMAKGWVTFDESVKTTQMTNTLRAFAGDAYDLVGGLGHLRESGIILSGTISTLWQTWALSKAVRERLSGEKPAAVTGDFSLNVFGIAALSAVLGLGVYRYSTTKDSETLFAFAYGAAAFLGPMIFLGHDFIAKRYEAIRAQLKLKESEPIPPEHIPESLRFQHAIFTSLAAAAAMGLMVWSVRDSLPPEGRTRLQVAQRAVAPVLAGFIVYAIASNALMSVEFEELTQLFKRKFSRKKIESATK